MIRRLLLQEPCEKPLCSYSKKRHSSRSRTDRRRLSQLSPKIDGLRERVTAAPNCTEVKKLSADVRNLPESELSNWLSSGFQEA